MSFNPRPRARGDAVTTQHRSIACWFQSTPPREGRPRTADDSPGTYRFQSTPPREGRHRRRRRRLIAQCFNPRPRARGDLSIAVALADAIRVSIHAPARGATVDTAACNMRGDGFNPRPRARGDAHARPAERWNMGFNPRPRARGDCRKITAYGLPMEKLSVCANHAERGLCGADRCSTKHFIRRICWRADLPVTM